MLIPSASDGVLGYDASLSRRVNANSQQRFKKGARRLKLIKKGEC